LPEELKLLIVDPDPNYRTDLKKMLARSGVTVVGEASYGADAVSLAQSTRPDAVAVHWQKPAIRAEQTLESLSLALPLAPLITYSEFEEHDSTRKAMQAGAHDYLLKPLKAKDVVEAIHKALLQIERRRLGEAGSADAITEGVIVAVFGAKGGIGKTTISTNLSAALATQRRESVALLDIDTRFGDVAMVLDLQPQQNIANAVQDIEELNRFNIRSYLTPHSTGINVMAAPAQPSEWRKVQPWHIEKIIKLLAQTHDYVLLDTPGFLTELVGVALDMADLVLLVTTLDLSSIKDSSMALDMLHTAGYPMDRVKLVVNRNTGIHSIKKEQIEDVTGCEVFWDIPFDKEFIRSGQLGSPLYLTKPTSRGARNIGQLAQSISGGGQKSRLFRKVRPGQGDAVIDEHISAPTAVAEGNEGVRA
jgi:pilus assembly protein CpaE